MSLIGVSFSIHADDTQAARRIDLLRRLQSLGDIWDEMPGLILIRTEETITDVRLQILLALNATTDRAVVFRTYRDSMKPVGPLSEDLP